MINKLTTVIGVLIIAAAVTSVFTHERTWIEVLYGITGGIVLIYVKNSSIVDIIKGLIKVTKP